LSLKILIVDPDESWLLTSKKFLEAQSYEVSLVSNGRDAQLEIYNNNFFAIILSYDTKNHSCLQVLKFLKTVQGNKKIIVTVNDKEQLKKDDLDEEKFEKLGVTQVLFHPFSNDDLKYILDGQQTINDLISSLRNNETSSPEEEVSQPDDMFTKIKIDEFYSSKNVLFDIFIRLNSNKYLKILHAGDFFDKTRIDKYRNDKNMEYLYFHNADRFRYIKYNNFVSQKILTSKAINIQTKVNLVHNVAEKFVEEVFTVGIKPQVVDQGKEICNTIFDLIEKENNLYQVLKSYQSLEPTYFSHAVLVTMYSSAIIKQFDWQSKTTIENMALACMLHDIGKTMLPKELLTMKVADMNEEQFVLYKTHPELGLKLIEHNKTINNTVKQIILQHHEYYDGSGFPFGRKGASILTLANIVCLVDDFVHLMTENKLAPVDALKKIITNKAGLKKYNSVLIEKFINIFVDPDKIKKENSLPSNSKIIVTKKML
jgi:response regulator RpfG family c-di-GMP phosphodiesterase